MHSNVTLPTQLGGPDAPTLTACADTLHTLFSEVDAAEVALMNVVSATAEVIATCAAEAVERASLESLLAMLGVTSSEGRGYVRAVVVAPADPALVPGPAVGLGDGPVQHGPARGSRRRPA
jgi:hypothetical protein